MYILKEHIRFQIYGSRNLYPHLNPAFVADRPGEKSQIMASRPLAVLAHSRHGGRHVL